MRLLKCSRKTDHDGDVEKERMLSVVSSGFCGLFYERLPQRWCSLQLVAKCEEGVGCGEEEARMKKMVLGFARRWMEDLWRLVDCCRRWLKEKLTMFKGYY